MNESNIRKVVDSFKKCVTCLLACLPALLPAPPHPSCPPTHCPPPPSPVIPPPHRIIREWSTTPGCAVQPQPHPPSLTALHCTALHAPLHCATCLRHHAPLQVMVPAPTYLLWFITDGTLIHCIAPPPPPTPPPPPLAAHPGCKRYGLDKVGYQYVGIDDCWAVSRDKSTGTIKEDPKAFPNGMKAVADYVHSKGRQ